MATVVNLASDETLVQEAYARVKDDWSALGLDQLQQVNLDLQLAAQTILGAWPEIKAFREAIAKQLPAFDLKQFDKIEDYALALMYVQSRYALALQPPNDLQELFEEAGKLRDMLQADAQALSLRGLFDGRKLEALKGGNGYKNLAQDLQALATELEAILPKIQGKAGTSAEDVKAATQMATRLTRVVGEREQAPVVMASLVEERMRAFNQLLKAYDDARAAVSFLRRREGDVDEIAPNLYTQNTLRKKAAEAPLPKAVTDSLLAQTPGTLAPVGLTGGAQVAGGAGVPVAKPGGSSEPFMS